MKSQHNVLGFFLSIMFMTTGALCTLDLDAGLSALLLSVELVAVSPTASEPELSAGIGCDVVVPLHHVFPARSWIQGLTAALC